MLEECFSRTCGWCYRKPARLRKCYEGCKSRYGLLVLTSFGSKKVFDVQHNQMVTFVEVDHVSCSWERSNCYPCYRFTGHVVTLSYLDKRGAQSSRQCGCARVPVYTYNVGAAIFSCPRLICIFRGAQGLCWFMCINHILRFGCA